MKKYSYNVKLNKETKIKLNKKNLKKVLGIYLLKFH